MVDARQRPKRIKSLPLRKCGLKLPYCRLRIGWSAVTSLAEVWIEIKTVSYLIRPFSSLPLRKCGLKWSGSAGYPPRDPSLPLRKCGLKLSVKLSPKTVKSHFPCGSVDWNADILLSNPTTLVTSLAEVWIEIGFQCGFCWSAVASLPLRKCGLKWRKR